MYSSNVRKKIKQEKDMGFGLLTQWPTQAGGVPGLAASGQTRVEGGEGGVAVQKSDGEKSLPRY